MFTGGTAMFAGPAVIFTRATVMSVAATVAVVFVAADANTQTQLPWARGGCARGKTWFSYENRGVCWHSKIASLTAVSSYDDSDDLIVWDYPDKKCKNHGAFCQPCPSSCAPR